MKNKDDLQPSGWRIYLSIGMGVGWLIFFIIWLAFFAGDYTVYQNVAIVLISILLVFIVLGGSWASWGIQHIPITGRKIMKASGFTSRIVISIAIPLALIIFWIIWFFFYAEGFNIYQNIAIFLVSILAIGGILGGMWASWGMKQGHRIKNYCEEKENKED